MIWLCVIFGFFFFYPICLCFIHCMSHVLFAICDFTDSVRGLLVLLSSINKINKYVNMRQILKVRGWKNRTDIHYLVQSLMEIGERKGTGDKKRMAFFVSFLLCSLE